MIHDAIVPVSCDGKGCGARLEIGISDEAIEEEIIEEGWRVEDGKHYCEDCGEGREVR